MSVLFAFLITLGVGLATGIGAIFAFFSKKENTLFLSVSLGFSAGMMIYLSFMEILPTSINSISKILSYTGFFIGALLIGLIDKGIPNNENPHEFFHQASDLKHLQTEHIRHHLLKTGIFTAFAIGLHNFPEGFATFLSLLEQPQAGVGIAIAVALHNIPEGIAVSVPIFYATGSRLKAFWYSFLSGLSEPIGALIGYLTLKPFLSEVVLGMVLSGTAGIMVYIALDELLPTAKHYNQTHFVIFSTFIGMFMVAFGLMLLP